MRSSNSPPFAGFIVLMLVAVTLAMCSTGCGSIPAADAKSEALNYNAIWPRHEKYLDADTELTAQDKTDYKQTGVTWRDKIMQLLKSAGVKYTFENGRFTLNDARKSREYLQPPSNLRQTQTWQTNTTLEGTEPERLWPFDRLTVRQSAPCSGHGSAG